MPIQEIPWVMASRLIRMFGRNLYRDSGDTRRRLIFLAFDSDQPIGAAVCFIGFSSFAAKPLINIHDFVVLPTSRGKGIGRRLLEAVEAKARELGCCKLTLEVMDKNHQAVRMYQAAGFERYALQEEAGAAIFMSKPLQ
jgi:GNAT superfamily N-acetyltransferase